MAKSVNETGHTQNLNSLDVMVKTCQGFGARYNPPRAALKVLGLQSMYTQTDGSLNTITTTLRTFSNVVNSRRILFDPSRKLSTRMYNGLKISAPTAESLADALAINRKIQGTRATKKEDAPPADTTTTEKIEPTTISVSQQSYVSIADKLHEFNTLLKTLPNYTPNETELQTATLTTYIASLKAKNIEFNQAEVDINNARISRNIIMYKADTGLYKIQQDVKDYVKSAFGASSIEYKQIRQIKFTDLAKPRAKAKTKAKTTAKTATK
jgi:hypothetical protein